MRLTLRTLLAYLDDTLEPAQAKLIGQKIAESEQARDLIERIQQVTRRRRITTPPDSGPGGKLDPNTLGEYLDNEITAEQANEVEEICLASDAHLAEVAASHQILSLILGEPALVPPSARQRMYRLVTGPEAIPSRKPLVPPAKSEHDLAEGRDVDDTLRLGMPPVTGKNRGNPWPLIVSGIAAACLLLVAIWQIIHESEKAPTPDANKNNGVVAQVDLTKPEPPPTPPERTVVPEKKKSTQTTQEDKKAEKKVEAKEPLPDIKLPPVVVDAPWAPPRMEVQPVGRLVADAKEPAVLVTYNPDKMEWESIGLKNSEVPSGRALVSLPAVRSVVQLDKGLKLTLAGSVYPELFYIFPLYESSVELHVHDHLDLDLTLRRGRIRVAAVDAPGRIRVRFDNPTQPNQKEYFDISLQAPGTEVLIDRWALPPSEKFYRNPKDPNRVGPTAAMACVVLAGEILLRYHDVSHNLTAPPGPAIVAWTSKKGLDQPVEIKTLPEGLKSYPPLPPPLEARSRTELLKARDELVQRLLVKAPDVALAESVKSNDASLRRLALESLGAVDEISAVLEQLEQEQAPELRAWAIDTLRHWIAAERDHDYKLFDLLKAKYRTIESENMLTLMHDFSPKDLTNPDTYDLLINYLNHPLLPLRELASWHLVRLAPIGQKIRYSASADPATRQQAQAQWRALIPPNQLPPPAPKK
jgi:hypothetical protein